MTIRSKRFWAAALAVCAGIAATAFDRDAGAEYAVGAEVTEAIAIVQATEGSTVTGIVRFSQAGGEVRIVADMEGLRPESKHGFHIHEYGDFTSPDAKSAGGHYNPAGCKHGGPQDAERHAGDLGNIESDGSGKAHYELTVDNISINGAKNPILGRGVVVHSDPDDFVTQPTGNSGARIGFGVIGIANPSPGG